jgi:hypothetical protein
MSGSIAALLQRLTQGVYVTFRSSSLKRDMTPECLKIAETTLRMSAPCRHRPNICIYPNWTFHAGPEA